MRFHWAFVPLIAVTLISWPAAHSVGKAERATKALPIGVPQTNARTIRRTHTLMPAEFEPVESLLVSWDPDLRSVYADIAAAVEGEASLVFLVGLDERADVVDMFAEYGLATGHVRFVDAETDTVWIRDYAPFRMRGTRGSVHERWVVEFDYGQRPNDDDAAKIVSKALWPREPVVSAPLRLDGGNILSNGTGVCVATTQVYELDPRHGRSAVRRLLRRFLGCRKLVVLPQLHGEPTGHVDMYVALSGRDHAIVGRFDPEEDWENAIVADIAATRLKRAGFRVERVRMPPNSDGYFRSHTNALAVNGIVLVPTYNEALELELEVIETFARAYPGRHIVPIDASDLIKLDGAIRCIAITIAR